MGATDSLLRVKEVSPQLKRLSDALRYWPVAIPGKARLARILLGSSLDAQDVRITDRWGNRFAVPNLRMPIAFYLVVNGVYEPLTTQFLMDRLQSHSTLVDIGANIGVFTVLLANRVQPEGCILAIEASPYAYRYLKHNIQINRLTNVRPKNCAVSDQGSRLIPFYESPKHFGMGSLAPVFTDQPIQIPTETLDALLEKEGLTTVDAIKVDVEGFEEAVFRGGTRILNAKNSPAIIFEFCDWAEIRAPEGRPGNAQRLLKEYGYKIWRLSDFLKRRKPLRKILTEGFEMLVAIKS